MEIAYTNGNTRVTLFPDGSKVREWEGEAAPTHPESMDLKITDFCVGAGCRFCHESSTGAGRHAPLDRLLGILDGMLPGSELAIGGGNPLSHPDLLPILVAARERGLVPNLTVNAVHLAGTDLEAIRPLIGGLGVSFNVGGFWGIVEAADDNTVVHLIAGVDRPFDLFRLKAAGVRKFLILGYKRFGRGVQVDEAKLARALGEWRYWIGTILRSQRCVISFDNLALEQLAVQEKVSAETWEESFMGNDGRFTFYIDAVRDEFAVSSTSPRMPRAGRSVEEMFAHIREITC